MAFADTLRMLNTMKAERVIEEYALAGAMAIEGLPTQFVPSPSLLAREAIASAADVEYQGVVVRVVRPEHLIALYLAPAARTTRRRERAAMLLELPGLNRDLVDEILRRHGLSF
jgi:hypothetical protein